MIQNMDDARALLNGIERLKDAQAKAHNDIKDTLKRQLDEMNMLMQHQILKLKQNKW